MILLLIGFFSCDKEPINREYSFEDYQLNGNWRVLYNSPETAFTHLEFTLDSVTVLGVTGSSQTFGYSLNQTRNRIEYDENVISVLEVQSPNRLSCQTENIVFTIQKE